MTILKPHNIHMSSQNDHFKFAIFLCFIWSNVIPANYVYLSPPVAYRQEWRKQVHRSHAPIAWLINHIAQYCLQFHYLFMPYTPDLIHVFYVFGNPFGAKSISA